MKNTHGADCFRSNSLRVSLHFLCRRFTNRDARPNAATINTSAHGDSKCIPEIIGLQRYAKSFTYTFAVRSGSVTF